MATHRRTFHALRAVAMLAVAAALGTALTVIEPVVGDIVGLPAQVAFADPALPTTISLAASQLTPAAGQSVTLTATTDVSVELSANQITIVDQTTATTIKTCTTGTTCAINVTTYAGGPHTYAAQTAALTSQPVVITRLPWAVSLTASTTVVSAGTRALLTATTNQSLSLTNSAYAVFIFDSGTGQRIGYCTTGTSCVFNTQLVYSGPSHDYVAIVAAASPLPTNLAQVADAQAQSNVISVSRQPWSVALTTNRTEVATGSSATLTATANQSVSNTSSTYRIYIFDVTTGTLVANCSTGTACAVNQNFYVGGPHDYVAAVAASGTPATLAAATDVQASSGTLALSRQPWSLSLATNNAVLSANQTATFTLTANQSVAGTSSTLKAYVFDNGTGAVVGSCTTGPVCTIALPKVHTGSPKEYVAAVAAASPVPTNLSNATQVQVVSNAVTISRMAWTLTLVGPADFDTQHFAALIATANQSLSSTAGNYATYVFDVTTGARITACTTSNVCESGASFKTGDPHTYVAIVASATNPSTLAAATDVQATSNEVTVARKTWTVTLNAKFLPVYASIPARWEISARANQSAVSPHTPYRVSIVDLTAESISVTCQYIWVACETIAPLSDSHSYVAYVSQLTNGVLWDIQAVSGIFVAGGMGPTLPGEAIGGGNPSEVPCQCPAADPVNTATGEFYLPATDISLLGVGPRVAVTRTYSSTLASVDGPFGFGWATSLSSALTVTVAAASGETLPRQVKVTQENGSTVLFNRDLNNGYLAAERVRATLAYDPATSEWIFTRQAEDVFRFNTAGAATSFSDIQGNTVTVTRDVNGKIATLTGSGGRTLTLTWTGSHVTQVADSAGRAVAYGYSPTGNLTSVTAVDGRVATYGYNAGHYMTSLVTPGGGTTTNVYDGSNRVSTQTDPVGRVTTFSYSASSTTVTIPDGSKTKYFYAYGQIASVIRADSTPLAATTSNVYDASGNVTSVTDPIGRVTTFTYDTAGNMLSKKDALNRITRWTYDAQRHPLSITDGENRTTTFAYDSVGNLVLTTSPSGKQTHWSFNADGTAATTTNADGKVTTYGYDASGRLTSATDPDGRTTSLTYNAAGIVTQQTSPGGASTTITPDAVGRTLSVLDPNSHETEYTYNTAGDLVSVLDARGNTTSSIFDAAGQLIFSTDAAGKTTEYTYTGAGLLSAVKDANNHTSTRVYDALGRVTSSTDGLLRTTTYTYDLAGQVLSTTLPSGAVTSVSYDAAGQAVSSTNALGKATAVTYNLAGQVLTTTDPLGRVVATAYDTDGRPATITLPDTSTRLYVYNAQGQPSSFTNGDGKVTSYAYSDAGSLLSKTEPGGLVTSYIYNAAGRASVVTQPDLSTAAYGYDTAGQLLQIDYSDPGTPDVTYTHDAAGHLLTMSDATGSSSFAYDSVGRLVSETNGAGAAIGYAYDNVGQLTTISYPGARIATYDYDAAGQMTSLTDWSSNETTFTWTSDGQLATQATPDSVTQTNSYDLAGQLTGIAHATPTDPLAEFTYGYDFAGQLVANSSTLDGSTIASDYGYDPISQLTAVTTTPSGGSATVANPDATPAGLLTTTVGGDELVYNAAQQVTSFTPVIGAATDFSYDARGSRVSATTGTDVTAFAYTVSGALASVTTATASVSYTYDARNLRQSRTVGAVTQQFTWSSVGGLPLLLGDGEHSYLYGPSSTPLARIDDTTGQAEYLHADLLGTPRLMTDDTGDVTGIVSFDAFGNRTTHSGVQSAFGFTGNLVDTLTGLLYLRARDYDPATGQFLAVDPAVDTTRQPYAYTGNNPVSRTDPTGLCPVNGGSNVADCTAADFGANMNLLSPELIALGDFLRPAENSFAGLGDGASWGLSEHWREANGLNCRIEKDGWYWAEYGLGTLGSIVTGGVVLSAGLKLIQSARGLFAAGKALQIASLATRANQIHGALDPFAQTLRTTAVLRTVQGVDIVAGGGVDLTRAQQGLLSVGEAFARSPGVHAEVTALAHATDAGLDALLIAVSRPICTACQTAIMDAGGTIAKNLLGASW